MVIRSLKGNQKLIPKKNKNKKPFIKTAFFIILIMGITSISSVVFSRLSWLDSSLQDDVDSVDVFICQSQYSLQTHLSKDDSEVEDEVSYSNREKLLTGLYTSYNLVCKKATENTAGIKGSQPSGNKVIKKG